MTEPTTEAERRSLDRVFSGRRVFALVTDAGEVQDGRYKRQEGRLTTPREDEGGGWAVWNSDAIEFPPFREEGEAEVRWIGIIDPEDGVTLAHVAVEPFRPQPRIQARFAIGKIVVRAGIA